jgi:lipoprotein-anchoring transpeptidase ErfK/SrfK
MPPPGATAGSPGQYPPPYGSPASADPWDGRTPAEAAGQLEPGRNLLRDNGQTLGNPLPGRSPGLGPANDFATAWQAIQGQLDANQLAEAHLALSRWYNHPDVPVEQVSGVIDLLDQLAGTVIYSRQHLLEGPYTVAQLDTPENISRTFQVPWQVLARINGVDSPQQLQPGQQLKVVRGPFRAEVDLHNMELTLFLQERYAGRFPIGVGLDHRDLTGSYIVSRKGASPRYVGSDQVTVEADDPANPYGQLWIGLQDLSGRETGVAIHGTNDPANLHRVAGRGAICLSAQDIDDVFGILSENSRVDIRGTSMGQP